MNQRDRAVAVRTARALGRPSVLAVGNQHTFWGPPPVPALKRRHYGNAARLATTCVATSEVVRDELVDLGVAAERCVVLHNGIDLGPFDDRHDREEARRSLGLASTTRVFANVGRLDVQKGQDVLLQAWARAVRPSDDARLLLVGDASDGSQAARSTRFKASLEAMVCELDLAGSVDFLWLARRRRARAGRQRRLSPPGPLGGVAVERRRGHGRGPPLRHDRLLGPPARLRRRRGRSRRGDRRHRRSGGGDPALLDTAPQRLAEMGRAARDLAVAHYDIAAVVRRFAEVVEASCGASHAGGAAR